MERLLQEALECHELYVPAEVRAASQDCTYLLPPDLREAFRLRPRFALHATPFARPCARDIVVAAGGDGGPPRAQYLVFGGYATPAWALQWRVDLATGTIERALAATGQPLVVTHRYASFSAVLRDFVVSAQLGRYSTAAWDASLALCGTPGASLFTDGLDKGPRPRQIF
jgi:hypothetical protein